MGRPGLFGVNEDNRSLDVIVEDEKNAEFLKCVRNVIKLLKIPENTHYSDLMSENILMMAYNVEEYIENFLINLDIPFSSEHFLLILFKELYENYMGSGSLRGNII
ncbi:MAG: hypothetical protein GF364_04380 [Candidatus Lokiarchaeota archaeon]|nr:hypothetical protein [Candidatus Lokiarchaeota archaeon]